jgi:predicted alpha/beta-hydrolase family hydrolase
MTRRRALPPGLLLTPGAGADRNQSALVAVDAAVTATGAVVERMDFPYRLAGRRAPDRAPVLIEAVRQGTAALAPRVGTMALGGRSMGGRICSMAVAEGLVAHGLILISYPLHPPGKPENLRVEHFPQLKVPCLFVSGTRDAFGRPEELQAATAAIPGPVTHHWIEGGDHGLRRADAQVAEVVAGWFSQVLAAPTG